VISPDGAYTWNGREWVPNAAPARTVSPDGAYVWSGSQWVPNVAAAPTRFRKEPSSWTRPLQLAVIVLTLIGDVNLLTLLPFLSDYITRATRRSIELSLASQPQTPNSDQINAQALAIADTIGTWVVITTLFFAALWLLLILIGTLRRWTWFYWVLTVIFALSILGLPQEVLQLFGVGYSGGPGQPELVLPLANSLLGLAVTIAEVALFVWMVVALRKYGPWACRKVPAP
jgi:hypothetical protein